MPDSPSSLPQRPSLEQLQKQAKELLRQYRAGVPAAQARLAVPDACLADAQFVLAREHGFASWAALRHHVETLRPSATERFERLASELAAAFIAGDKAAVREINWRHGTGFAADLDPGPMQERLTTWFAAETRTPDLALADARGMVAQSYGFQSWDQFAAGLLQPPSDPRTTPFGVSTSPPFYQIDWQERSLRVRGPHPAEDWDTLFALLREYELTALYAGGITDAAMERMPRLDHLKRLELGGSIQLTDEGARHLARMPQLEELDLGGWKSPITDRGFEPLRELKHLRHFKTCWTQGISDAGLAHLAGCEHLEEVNLMGTPTGDGAIAVLGGKPELRHFRSGRLVTDAGLALLHRFPQFAAWRGGTPQYSLMSADAGPTLLMLDGPFTNQGLAALPGLDGLFGLTFFWHCTGFTGAGLAALQDLPNLGFLGCQDDRCDDEAMRHIAAIPRLRMLMGQGAVASDDGFTALSHSKSLEYFWGRDCPNFAGRGFSALSEMSSLHGLAVSCKNVDDAALSRLPHFPALREFMPMDVPDDGFRHVGACSNLEALWCMYCRETSDAATSHIARLPLKSYYAGATRITDASLQILGRVDSLEKLEFWQCAGLTDAGVSHLTRLPRLREITLDGLLGVTSKSAAAFTQNVRVKFST